MTASPPLLGDMPSPGLSEGRVAFWESGCDGGGRRETAAPLRDGAGPSVLPLAGAGGLREGSPWGGLGCPLPAVRGPGLARGGFQERLLPQ